MQENDVLVRFHEPDLFDAYNKSLPDIKQETSAFIFENIWLNNTFFDRIDKFEKPDNWGIIGCVSDWCRPHETIEIEPGIMIIRTALIKYLKFSTDLCRRVNDMGYKNYVIYNDFKKGFYEGFNPLTGIRSI